MKVITDLGAPIPISTEDGEQTMLGRYGVWEDAHRRKPEVIATGDDLDELQKQYGPNLEVVVLSTGKSRVGET